MTPQQKQQKYCENEFKKCYCIKEYNSDNIQDCVKSTDTKTTVPFIKTRYNPGSICGGVNYNPNTRSVNENSCKWYGTQPWCQGKCPNNMTNIEQKKCVFSGEKVLCINNSIIN